MENIKIKNIIEQLTKDKNFINQISDNDFNDVELTNKIINHDPSLYKKLPLEIKKKEIHVEFLLSKHLQSHGYKYSDFPENIREDKHWLLKLIKINSIKFTKKEMNEICEKYKCDKDIVECLCIFNSSYIIDGYFDSPLFGDIEFIKEIALKHKNEHIFVRFGLHKIPKKYVTKELVLALCEVDEAFYRDAFLISVDKKELLETFHKIKGFSIFDGDLGRDINKKMVSVFKDDKEIWKSYFDKLDDLTKLTSNFPEDIMFCLVKHLEDYDPAKDLVAKLKGKIDRIENRENSEIQRREEYEKEKIELVSKYYSSWENDVKKLLPKKDLEFIEIMASDSKEGEYIRKYFFGSKLLSDFKFYVCQEYKYSVNNKYECENYAYCSDVSRKKLFSNIIVFSLEGYDTLLVSYYDGYFVATDTEGIFSGCAKNIWETPLFATERKLSKKYEEFCEKLGFKFENSQKYIGICIGEWSKQNREEARVLRKKKEKEFLDYITQKKNKKFWVITEKTEEDIELTETERKIFNEGNHYYLSGRHFISYEEYVFELTKNGFTTACIELSTLPYVLNDYDNLEDYRKFCDKNLIAINAFKGHSGELIFGSEGDYINTPELSDYWSLLERKKRMIPV